MTDAIDVLSASLRADAEALRMIGQNVANAQSTAYRREVAVVAAPFDAAVQGAEASLAALASLPTATTAVDWRAGSLQLAAAAWNVALEGDGWLVVSTSAGERLTRRGDFHVDGVGRLVTAQGAAVLGGAGEIVVPAGVPTIAADGTIRVGDRVIDRLRIVHADPRALEPVGDSLYRPGDAANVTEGAVASVRQGFLESSNVQPVEELVRLMETMRHFETTQRMIRGADEMLDNAIATFGKT